MPYGPLPPGEYDAHLYRIDPHGVATFRIDGGEYDGHFLFAPAGLITPFVVEVDVTQVHDDPPSTANVIRKVRPK